MLSLHNTLTKKLEKFVPRNPDLVTLYCCGPTVYDYAHIGNFRTYTMTDLLVRTLKYLGYKVRYVMNVTDVGHLVSDADEGEDKLEKGARRENKTAWDIAKFYTDAFLTDSQKLNLLEPDVRPKPTEHILEQIEMVEILLKKGFAYQIDDGIYFDTAKFVTYGQLTGQNLEDLKAGARVEPNTQKRNPTDFALWKFSPPGSKRQMEWPSPWGVGFPGWHIECSAMSAKHLGTQIDIHTGGADLIPIHHTNEIAQSEAASGLSPFVKYWLHGQFIQVDGEKMAKSKGNFYRLQDIIERGYDPLALRYFYLTAHYRSFLNFTWEALDQASQSLGELKNQISGIVKHKNAGERLALSPEKLSQVDELRADFTQALESDVNLPQALAVTWKVVKSNIPPGDKYDLAMSFDEVLGLNLQTVTATPLQVVPITPEIAELIIKRDQFRDQKDFASADAVRGRLIDLGYQIEDTPQGVQIKKALSRSRSAGEGSPKEQKEEN